jgi:hypothetical protein
MGGLCPNVALVDLAIYHGGSMSGTNLEYIGGSILGITDVDADSLCFMDIVNLVHDHLGYKDNGQMFYKFDADGYDGRIHGLKRDGDII